MNLTDYVQKVSQEDFEKAFLHQAMWNKRLRSTGGRFFPHDCHLDFNPKIYEEFGLTIFRQIVRHELCHYHLYREKKGYRHQDADFKKLLKEVDGLRYTPSLKQATSFLYQCQQCRTIYSRKRRINLKRYRCGKCHGRLFLLVKKKSG